MADGEITSPPSPGESKLFPVFTIDEVTSIRCRRSHCTCGGQLSEFFWGVVTVVGVAGVRLVNEYRSRCKKKECGARYGEYSYVEDKKEYLDVPASSLRVLRAGHAKAKLYFTLPFLQVLSAFVTDFSDIRARRVVPKSSFGFGCFLLAIP